MVIGIGCDIVQISRIRSQIHSEAFLRCILSEREYGYSERYPDARKAEWIAGRFAAKEAIYKALNAAFPCTLSQIEILSDEAGRPICTFPNYHIQISIAHEKEYAIAYAIAHTKE